MTSPYTGLADRRAADRRILPAADALGAHMQRKAADERAALAEQQRDELLAFVQAYLAWVQPCIRDIGMAQLEDAARALVAKATGSAS